MVGVSENQSRPTGMDGVDAPRQSDLQTQIASKILAAIDPRPRFEVHPVPLQQPGKFVVLVRVQEGDDPPYFLRDAVFVRELDACKKATRVDLINMAERRKGSGAAEASRQFPGGDLVPFPFPAEWKDDKFYVGLWARPLRKVAVELDAVREEALMKTIVEACSNAQLNVVLRAFNRDADYVELRSEGAICGNWRFCSDGALGFAAIPRRVGDEFAVELASLARTGVLMCTCAARLFEREAWFSRIVLQGEASIPDGWIIGTGEELSLTPDLGTIPLEKPPSGNNSTRTVRREVIDYQELKVPHRAIARFLNYHLRAFRGASLNVDRLAAFVEQVSAKTSGQ